MGTWGEDQVKETRICFRISISMYTPKASLKSWDEHYVSC